jgi:signal transduction histidine kinase
MYLLKTYKMVVRIENICLNIEAMPCVEHVAKCNDMLENHHAEPVLKTYQQSVSGPGRIRGVAMIHETSRLHLLEQRTRMLDTLSTIVEMLLQLPAPEAYVDAAGSSSAMLQQVAQHIVDLTQQHLGCAHVSLLVIDHNTKIFYPAALAGFSVGEAQRFRANIAGFRLSDLLIDPETIVQLEDQEVLRFDITQSPLLQSIVPLVQHPIWHLMAIQAHHTILGLLGIQFFEADYHPTSDDLLLMKAMRKLSALLIEYEHQSMERANLIFELQLMNEHLKAANVQLEAANNTQGNFISVIGHEFRSALTSIQGFSELLGEGEFDHAEVRNFAADILSDALRLKHLIDDMLELKQLQAGNITLQREYIDLNGLLREVVKRFRSIGSQHPIYLRLDKALPLIKGDREKLMHVVSNLLSNAVKYSPALAPIVVHSKLEQNLAHVIVRDNGIGIASVDLERIFSAYRQPEGKMVREHHEVGLGLPIVRQIIEMHGGRTWAEGTPGEGSHFHFTLPQG